MVALESRLAVLEAERAIRNVLQTYCRGVDRKDFDLFRTAYHPDAVVQDGAYSGDVDGLIAWLEERHRDIEQSMHFIGSSTIDLEGSVATVETYCVVHQRTKAGPRPAQNISIGCRYLDRMERRAGGWAIADHLIVFEWWYEAEALNDKPFDPRMTYAQRSLADAVYARGPWPGTASAARP